MFVAHFIILPATAFINSFLISKWKILIRGRYFGLRSIGASFFGDLVYAILICPIVFWGTLPTAKILITMVASFSLKVLYSFFLAYPAVWVANFIKLKEKIDVYDYRVNYNPFKLNK